ncbi:MAG: 1-deoxy-D-xylulose-5-phosphate synthase, partial [Clostridia bacterium]|nr:1-deoxy-D-xylulose-5-phosphate synthase [Clostridia bacterium]
EQHAATFSAALAKGGMRPYFAVYSSFLQRAYDQIIHDIAISGLPVVLCVDRAGFVGADGETHHGLFDIAYLSSVPGMTVYSPSSFEELRLVLKNTLSATGPTAVRYPRGGEEPSALSLAPDREFLLQGDGGSDALIVTYGSTVGDAAEAVKQLSEKGACCHLLKLVRVHPVPQEAVKAALNYRHVFFFEEAVRSGSVGAAFAEQLCSLGFAGCYRHAAVEDCFVSHDSVTQQRSQFGLDARGICDLISEVIL